MLLASAGITKKSKRLPQAREVFSQQNYKEVVQPIVTEKLTQIAHEAGRAPNRKETMKVVQNTIEEEYKAASQEVKDAIAEHIAQEKQKAVAAREAQALELNKARTPEEYQACVIPGLLIYICSISHHPQCARHRAEDRRGRSRPVVARHGMDVQPVWCWAGTRGQRQHVFHSVRPHPIKYARSS